MYRSPKKTANRPRDRLTSWLNFSKTIEPSIERTLTWFEVLGYSVLLRSDIVAGRHQAIWQSYCNGILGERFCEAMQRINPTVSFQQIDSILNDLTAIQPMPIVQQNRRWHLQLLNGIAVDSSEISSSELRTIKLVDFTNLANNDWLAIYSFPAIEGDYQQFAGVPRLCKAAWGGIAVWRRNGARQ